MSRHSQLPAYHAQLLRMWVEQPTQRSPIWRFSLEDVNTQQRSGFADLDALITHLLTLMEECHMQRAQEERHARSGDVNSTAPYWMELNP